MGQLKLPGIAGSRPNVRRCLAAWVRPNSLAASGAACGCKSRLRLQKPLVAVKATCSCKSHLWLQKPLVAAKATCSNQSHLRLQKSLAAEKSLVAAKATCGYKSRLQQPKPLVTTKAAFMPSGLGQRVQGDANMCQTATRIMRDAIGHSGNRLPRAACPVKTFLKPC